MRRVYLRARSPLALGVLTALALSSLTTSRAEARAILPPPVEPPHGEVMIEGDVIVTEGDVHVRCGTFDFIGVAADCRVTARLTLRASAPSRVVISGALDDEELVLLDGSTPDEARWLAPGRDHELFVRFDRSLSASPDVEESPYVVSASFARHPLLGEHRAMGTASDTSTIVLARGARFVGVLHVDARGRGSVEVEVGERGVEGRVDQVATEGAIESLAAIGLSLSRDRTHAGPVANGGLFAVIGLAIALADGAERGAYALGYEWILEDAYFFSLALETDGASLREAFVVEIASPAPLYIVPSFSAGLGVVARQLGARPADAALRMRLSAQLPVFAGVVCDLDYWPSIGELTLSVGGRISL